ncbi:MAG TPA: hypothetical protein VF155_06670 [Candidatus Dormibacteraeota bacterium]
MAEPNQRAAAQSEQRPTLVLIAYCWDMLLGILAIFGALAALGGQVAVGARQVTIPLPLQILDALSSAAYAAILIMIASLLTRPKRWIRTVQIVTMASAVTLVALSLLLAAVTGGLAAVPLLISLLFALLDVAAIVLMTERKIKNWYVEPGSIPRYVLATLGFWVLSSVALLIVESLV